MTTPPETDRKAFIMIWTVENFSCSLTNVEYFSPEFTNNVDRKTFQLCVKRDRNNLVDFRLCHNVQGVDLDAELSLLNSEGSVLASERFEHQIAFSLHKVCILKWDSDNLSILIMRCKIWTRNALPISKNTVLARTRLGEECVSFIWPIKDYACLHKCTPPSRRIEMKVQEQPIVLRFEIFFGFKGPVAVTLHYMIKNAMSINSTFKISVLDSLSQAVLSKTDSRVIGASRHFYKKLTQTVSFPYLRKHLIKNKDYLPQGVLSLRCDVIMKGMPVNVLQDDQSSVRNWGVVADNSVDIEGSSHTPEFIDFDEAPLEDDEVKKYVSFNESSQPIIVDETYSESNELEKFEDIQLPCYLYSSVKYPKENIFLYVGGETHGVDPRAVKLACDYGGKKVKIPLENAMDSLNSSFAMTLVLYEIKRQLLERYVTK